MSHTILLRHDDVISKDKNEVRTRLLMELSRDCPYDGTENQITN